MKLQDAANASNEFIRGPALVPKAALMAWLDASRSDIGQRRVRLPVWLEISGSAIVSARIGGAAGPDAVALKIDDGAMGISILDRALHASRSGGPVALWLEGVWRGDGRFSVLRFIGAITAAEADGTNFVEIQPAP